MHSANAGKEARMPGYTVTRLEEAEDVLGDYPGEMRMLAGPLGSEQVAFTYRRMPQHTGGKGSYGHRHAEQEEIYFVISGTLQFKLEDDVIECEKGTAIRVAPEVYRSIWNDEPEDAEIVIVSTRADDSRPQFKADFWPEGN
jgi:mannose-6-phosphate isomerase-like protein (cupin superfamily)